MEISVTAEDMFEEYRKQIGQINHELILEKVKSRKLFEKLQEFEKAEVDRVHAARRQVAAQPPAAPQKGGDGPMPRELLRAIPEPPPLPPKPDSGPSRT